MSKMNLKSTYTNGKWNGKTVEEIMDKEWFAFDKTYEKLNWLYSDEVKKEYVDKKARLANLYKNNMQTYIDLKNT